MVRWEPGGSDRLREAALELYVQRGFEQTTVAEIAEAAGLTERTFFRHFADKREVLFNGQEILAQTFLDGLAAAPADAAPLAAVANAVSGAAVFFGEERREYSRKRQTVIDAHPALQERELLKMTTLASALAAALRDRGVADPAATLAAQSGITVFTVSFAQWIADGETRPIDEIERAVFAELGALTNSGHGVATGCSLLPDVQIK